MLSRNAPNFASTSFPQPAGIHSARYAAVRWMPAFAGMTSMSVRARRARLEAEPRTTSFPRTRESISAVTPGSKQVSRRDAENAERRRSFFGLFSALSAALRDIAPPRNAPPLAGTSIARPRESTPRSRRNTMDARFRGHDVHERPGTTRTARGGIQDDVIPANAGIHFCRHAGSKQVSRRDAENAEEKIVFFGLFSALSAALRECFLAQRTELHALAGALTRPAPRPAAAPGTPRCRPRWCSASSRKTGCAGSRDRPSPAARTSSPGR